MPARRGLLLVLAAAALAGCRGFPLAPEGAAPGGAPAQASGTRRDRLPSRAGDLFGARQDAVSIPRAGRLLGPPEWEVVLSTTGLYQVPSPIDGTGGKLEAWTGGGSIEAGRPLWYASLLDVRATYEGRRYRFRGENDLFPGTSQPFDVMHSMGVGGSLLQALSPTWAVYASASVSASFQDGADPAEGIATTAVLMGGHEFHPSFRAGAGIVYVDRTAESPYWLPGVLLDWKATPRLRVLLEGLAGQVSWRIAAAHSVALTGGYDTRRYRLKDGGVTDGGVVEDDRAFLGLRYAYLPDADVSLSLLLGTDLWRELDIEDRAGNARTRGTSPRPFVGASISVRL
jgi:hypothetical protein